MNLCCTPSQAKELETQENNYLYVLTNICIATCFHRHTTHTHTHVHHAYAHTHRRIKMQHQRLAQEMHEIAVAGLIQRKPKMKASRSLPAIIMNQPPRARVSSSLVPGSLFESKTSWASVASHAWMGEGPRKTLCYHFNWMQTPNHKN